ncbi:hypothetical protein, partial [Wenyingzhuangia sp. 2_MG-2023]|uniref:hypothetical protein n=1 Tax=Wenyingzhuangia sp. 2_MG-2023 TaxID=3062639 RepID=UPI0026E3F6F0
MKSKEQQFIQSIERIETDSDETHRNQNRVVEKPKPQNEFSIVPNTDCVLSANRKWISELKIRWENPLSIFGYTIPV